MATSSAPLPERTAQESAASAWAQGLGKVFRRVALFRIDGTNARVLAVHGMGPPPLGAGVSLLDPTPLRWAIEAASPLVGAGSAPGGGLVAHALSLSPPRAFAVIPLVVSGRLEAIAYVDQTNDPLPIAAAAELFAFTARVLKGQSLSPSSPSLAVQRLSCRSTRSRPRARVVRKPWMVQAPVEEIDTIDIVEVDEPVSVITAVAAREDVTVPDHPAVVQVRAEVSVRAKPRRWLRYTLGSIAALFLLVLGGVATIAAPLSPPARSASGEKTVQIPRNTAIVGIAAHLEKEGLVRSAASFVWMARLTHTDRSLKAGVYRLPTGVWAWAVLDELRHGQVHTRTITVPEGLTLTDVANLLEANGLARATDILREANEPEFLKELGVPGPSLEGFIFPESYTLSLGLSAREILSVMYKEFKDRLATIPGSATVSKEELLAKVTLASIVEREVRSKTELARVAGVFLNRIERNMRLESCATVQYILGKPKPRLTLADVRIESPYNTYLKPGLPPGPIANPGLDSLKAVFSPERTDYLFFFARQDGSHTHVFSRTYTEHQKRQKMLSHS